MKEGIHEDFRGHDEDLGIGIGLDVAREETEGNVRIFARKLGVLLIGQGLDRTRVDDFLAIRRRRRRKMLECEFRRQRLARSRVRRDEDMVALQNALDGILLKRTQIERVLFKMGLNDVLTVFAIDVGVAENDHDDGDGVYDDVTILFSYSMF